MTAPLEIPTTEGYENEPLPQAAHVPLIAATALALGCGSDSGSPVDPGGGVSADGSLSFSFAGVISGNYSASGPVRDDSPSWAYVRESGNTLEVLAFNARSATRGDVAFVTVPGSATGTHSITDGNAEVDFLLNTNAASTDFDLWCWLETGSVTVTSATTQRIQGTFSGEGACWSIGDEDVQEPFSISGGQFNAPFRD